MCFDLSYVTHYLESLCFLIIRCNRKCILLILLKSFSIHFQCFGIYFKSFAWTTMCLCSYLSRLSTLCLTSLCAPALKWTLLFTLYKVAQSPQSAHLNFGPHIYRETPPKTNTNKLKQDETWFKRCLPALDPFNHSGTSTASFPNLLGEIYFPTSAPTHPTPPPPASPGRDDAQFSAPSLMGRKLRLPHRALGEGRRRLQLSADDTWARTLQQLSDLQSRLRALCVFQCGEHTSNSFALQMFCSY